MKATTLFRPFGPAGPSWSELTRQALSSTVGGYDQLAPRFVATPFRTPDAILARSLASVESLEDAIDLCCGTGAALSHLAPRTRGRLVGLDASPGMLAEARRRWAHARAVELIEGDALEPPTELHGAFDQVTCYGAFGHVLAKDEPRLVAAVHRLLRPGGRFVFVTTERGRPTIGRALARAFNGAMRVRNALWKPPFIMYYLTFERARAQALLDAAGFTVEVQRGLFDAPFGRLVNVVATRQ
jgi:SAM-dependent methyltransferase